MNDMPVWSHHWLTSERMTLRVEVKNGVIAWTPPIARMFIGQPLANLIRWMQKQPGFRYEQLA